MFKFFRRMPNDFGNKVILAMDLIDEIGLDKNESDLVVSYALGLIKGKAERLAKELQPSSPKPIL